MAKKKQQNIKLRSQTKIRVRFSEVDSMQIVWHGNYVHYFEDGREAFGKEYSGLSYMDIYKSGYTAPIVDMTLQYKRPLKFDDTAIVETRYIGTQAAKICFEYEIRRESDGEVIATGTSIQVFLDGNGELQLLSPEFYMKWKEKWDLL
ncbi:MAG: thioesterase family protein [Rikenellaceae bacterium]